MIPGNCKNQIAVVRLLDPYLINLPIKKKDRLQAAKQVVINVYLCNLHMFTPVLTNQ